MLILKVRYTSTAFHLIIPAIDMLRTIHVSKRTSRLVIAVYLQLKDVIFVTSIVFERLIDSDCLTAHSPRSDRIDSPTLVRRSYA